MKSTKSASLISLKFSASLILSISCDKPFLTITAFARISASPSQKHDTNTVFSVLKSNYVIFLFQINPQPFDINPVCHCRLQPVYKYFLIITVPTTCNHTPFIAYTCCNQASHARKYSEPSHNSKQSGYHKINFSPILHISCTFLNPIINCHCSYLTS